MYTGPLNSERRRVIEEYRLMNRAETAGLSDVQVEALALGLPGASTEALVHTLSQRGYGVVLEVG
jgi:hypothetical protein